MRLVSGTILFGLCVATSHAAPLSNEPHRLLYQVYVESFQDGRLADGNGDFRGLEDRLDYLSELGVGGILLMPVFDSTGGMGYIPKDYGVLRRDYGAAAAPAARETAFRSLVAAAHARGMKVLLDTPINHIGTESAWFEKSRRRVAGFEDWFRWSTQPIPGWRRPWDERSSGADVFHFDAVRGQYFYGLFSPMMPDLNHELPAVRDAVAKTFRYWSERGVDGFRIDAAKHLVEGRTNVDPLEPANRAALVDYLSRLRAQFPDTSFLLEAWSRDPREFEPYLPDAGDVVFDFAYMESLRDSIKHAHPWAVRNVLAHIESVQDQIAPGHRIVFAGNHDVSRLRTFVLDDRGRVELSLALTLLLPFTPLVYYGDEIFMPGDYRRATTPGTRDTVEVATPMAWSAAPNAGFTSPDVPLGDGWNKRLHADYRIHNVATEAAEPQSLLNFVKRLTKVRRALPIDNSTRFDVASENPDDVVLRYAMRFADGTCVAVYLNFSAYESHELPLGRDVGCAVSAEASLVAQRSSVDRTRSVVRLAPQAIWVGRGR